MKGIMKFLAATMLLAIAMFGMIRVASAADLGPMPQPNFAGYRPAAPVEEPVDVTADYGRPFYCYGSLGVGAQVVGVNVTDGSALAARNFSVPLGIGCDYRFNGPWIMGASLGYDVASVSKEGFKISGTWNASIRGGYYIQPHLLAYAKIGLAGAHMSGVPEQSSLRGVPIGFGAELRLSQNGWLRFEYMHTTWKDFTAGVESARTRTDNITASYVFRF